MADSRDLTTIQSVLNWMNTQAGTPQQAEQAVVQQCITAASLSWLHYTGRSTLNSILPFNERYDGSGSDRLFLRNSPILKVFKLNIGGLNIPASADGLTSPGWWIDDDRESIILVGSNYGPAIRSRGNYGFSGTSYRSSNGWQFIKGRQTCVVSYLAGYNLKDAEPTTVAASVSVGGAATFVIDMGVTSVLTGVTFTEVPVAPAPGQYAVSSVGVYTFNVGDAGQKVSISYGYNGVPTDLQEAMNKFVHQNYNRRRTIDEKSKIMAGIGSTIYRDWFMAPEVNAVLQVYKRQSLFVS